MSRAPLLLCVLDGFGEAPAGPGNAIDAAEPKFWRDLRQKYPSTLLSASGEDVGLPCGLMGNSGHWNQKQNSSHRPNPYRDTICTTGPDTVQPAPALPRCRQTGCQS